MIQEALNIFKLPYMVEAETDAGNYTLYHLRAVGAGATLNRLKSRLDDLKAYIGQDMTIQTDGGVALRVEKQDKETYLFHDYAGYVANSKYKLPFLLGLTETGIVVEDLTKCPHLLVAGTTGSGKSSFLHTFIMSMMFRDNLYMYLVDCKRVEFSVYEKNCLIVNDVYGAKNLIKQLVDMIDKRYEAMRRAGVNNFADYQKVNPKAKYNILVVDELADLISTKEAKKAIVPQLLRIAQIGRAAGFHMVLATQRPDTSVINGTLKGNIPARISFNVASRFDSQVVLDRSGAEYLNGNGDGLYLKNGARDLQRFQSTYISMNELRQWAK